MDARKPVFGPARHADTARWTFKLLQRKNFNPSPTRVCANDLIARADNHHGPEPTVQWVVITDSLRHRGSRVCGQKHTHAPGHHWAYSIAPSRCAP